MYFKHPELLYALFLLIIPILIHLFQLRKFQKEAFTNVKFLQKISLQTRKSSKLKKWLILCTRLLAFAAIIIAFAQPFFINASTALKQNETVVYLDNSYSMQARGSKGPLLQRALQDILAETPQNETFSLLTNNDLYKNIQLPAAQAKLQNIDFSSEDLDLKTIKLKAQNLFSDSESSKKNLILISDFQEKKGTPNFEEESFATYLVQLQPESKRNITVDTAFIVQENLEAPLLNVELLANAEGAENIPVSIYNSNKLIGKSSAVFSENEKRSTVTFSLPKNEEIKGLIQIEDSNLQFDNQLYFSTGKTEKIDVVSISEIKDDFLKRIFNAPDFHFSSFPPNQVEYNSLANAGLIILNELKEIPPSLINNLDQFASDGKTILIIPSADADLQDYNLLFRNLNFPTFSALENQEKLISEIVFAHPLYENVFDQQVANFEYPKVNAFYKVENNAIPILKYEDQEAFLLQKENVYAFTAAINEQNSNFQNSPLIVPTLFNIGKTALENKQSYYLLNQENMVEIPVNVGKDEILKLSGPTGTFIPQQESFPTKVRMIFNELPEAPNNFSVLKNKDSLANLSFNIARSESEMKFLEIENTENVSIENSLASVFEEIKAQSNIDELWKSFVIFALLFLLIEMLILKFLK